MPHMDVCVCVRERMREKEEDDDDVVLIALGGQKHDLWDPRKSVTWIYCATTEGLVTCGMLFLTHLRAYSYI